MKLFKQFTIIIALSFIGEVLHALIPFPIPASIYGILLLFLLLEQKILQVDDVKEVSDFLIFIMPLLFVPAAVGLIDTWDELRASLTAYVTIIIAVTLIVMIVTGLITQWFLRHNRIHEYILANFHIFWHIHHAVLLWRRHVSETEGKAYAGESAANSHRLYDLVSAPVWNRLQNVQQQREIHQLPDDAGHYLPGGTPVPTAGYTETKF